MKTKKPHGLTGRPSNRGTKPPTSTRSLRLPVAVWDELQRQADAKGVTLNKYAQEILEKRCERPSMR